MKRVTYIDGAGTVCCFDRHSDSWMIKEGCQWEVDHAGVIDFGSLQSEDNIETVRGLTKFMSERVCYTVDELHELILSQFKLVLCRFTEQELSEASKSGKLRQVLLEVAENKLKPQEGT